MDLQNINFLAVLLAGAANMLVGALWYHPKFLGTMWMQDVGKTPEEFQKSASSSYAITTFTAIVLGFALEVLASNLKLESLADALTLGVIVGLGIVFTTTLPDYLYAGRKPRLFLINVFYPIIATIVMSMIVVVI